MENVNIMIGRFQPFTKGHYKCVEEAWRQRHIPTVIAMIDTIDAKVDEKHPFPSSLLLPLYKESFKNDTHIADIILIKSANIVVITEECRKNGYEIVSWTCGSDRMDTYIGLIGRCREKARLCNDFELIEIFRTEEDISATAARQALLEDDENTFKKMIPTYIGTKYYETLKSQLNKVMNK